MKGLEGVDKRLLDKLEGAKVQSVSDLATSTASELLEEYYSNYDDSGIGFDLETISQAVIKAKQKLIEDGLLQKDFSNAEDMLELRKKLVKITTGSQSLDLFLGGGIETQALTEIAGEFGSGKSQFCYTLCVTANMSNKENGIIFVDTENTFRAERVHQITIKAMLEETGSFHVDTFNDPDLTLKRFKPNFYALAIIDIMMPKMGGFELYKHLKKLDPDLKVCFLTASEMYHQKVREVEHCALNKDLFLQKPISNKDLVREIDNKIINLGADPT